MIRPLKFPLTVGMNYVAIPGSYGGSHVAFQDGSLQMWTTVNNRMISHKDLQVYVALTGEVLPEGYDHEYLGTAISGGGSFVVHAYRLSK